MKQASSCMTRVENKKYIGTNWSVKYELKNLRRKNIPCKLNIK